MIEIQYKDYITTVTICKCCNKYTTDVVVKLIDNNLSRVFIEAKDNILTELKIKNYNLKYCLNRIKDV